MEIESKNTPASAPTIAMMPSIAEAAPILFVAQVGEQRT
jgi:hypothetical protein